MVSGGGVGVVNGLRKTQVSQNFCQISEVSQSCFFRGYVHLAFAIFSQISPRVLIFLQD